MAEFENIINRIKEYLDDLKLFESCDLSEKKDYYAASMVLFSIINDCIALAELYMSKQQMPAPASYSALIDYLGKQGIITKKISTEMKTLIYQRNLIAHEYGIIQPEDISEMIKKMKIVKQFLQELSKEFYKL